MHSQTPSCIHGRRCRTKTPQKLEVYIRRMTKTSVKATTTHITATDQGPSPFIAIFMPSTAETGSFLGGSWVKQD